MKLDKINLNGEKRPLEVGEKVFAAKINNQLISSVIYRQNANFKGRKAKTKQKNEIIGSTSKIYAQKGTGNARHASRKAPIFVGGGVAHGPKGENKYKVRKLNKSEKKLSVISILTIKNNSKDLIVLDDFDKDVFKTKEMSKILKKLDADNSLMIFDKNSRNKIIRSVKNIPNVKLTDINHFSSFDLIKYKKIILTETSVKEIEKRYSWWINLIYMIRYYLL